MNTTKLYSKLLEIQKSVDNFIKDKSSFGYKYADGNQVLGKIRPLMNDKGIILKQEVINMQNTRIDYITSNGKEKSEILTETWQKFTWIDCESGEKDENLFCANGFNDWEKGLGSALTYGERYFLLKYFHAPTDNLDPDSKDRNKSKGYDKPKIDVWLSNDQFYKVKSLPKEQIKNCLQKYNGQTFGDGKTYGMKKTFRDELTNLIK